MPRMDELADAGGIKLNINGQTREGESGAAYQLHVEVDHTLRQYPWAASSLLSLSSGMDLQEFSRRIIETILRDAMSLLSLCREP
jgi:thiamine biosynthesis protein ThiC